MRTLYKIPVCLIITGALLLPGCQQKNRNEIILAQVGNSTLTKRGMSDNIPLGFQEMFSKEQKIEFINRWIDDELLYQEALREKLHQDKDIVQAINQLSRDFLIQKLLERKLEENITITDEEIKYFYQNNQDMFILEQPTIHAQQILVKNSKTAWEVKRKLRKPDNQFGALAKQYSIDPSADLEGDMGYVTEWDVDPLIARRCFRLKAGAVSNPIRTHSGYHILKILEKRDKGDPKPLDLVRDNIINILNKQKKKESLERLVKELKRNYPITINLSALDRNPGPSRPAAPEPPGSQPAAIDNGDATDAQDKY